jgi:hypothetical protein
MTTIKGGFTAFKPLQEAYNRLLYAIGIWQLECPCSCKACMHLREMYKKEVE